MKVKRTREEVPINVAGRFECVMRGEIVIIALQSIYSTSLLAFAALEPFYLDSDQLT